MSTSTEKTIGDLSSAISTALGEINRLQTALIYAGKQNEDAIRRIRVEQGKAENWKIDYNRISETLTQRSDELFNHKENSRASIEVHQATISTQEKRIERDKAWIESALRHLEDTVRGDDHLNSIEAFLTAARKDFPKNG